MEGSPPQRDNVPMQDKSPPPYAPQPTIKRWREFRGLTLEQVGNKLGIGGQAVHKWEAGKTPLTVEKLRLLAELYGTTPDALLHNPDEADLVERMKRAYELLRRMPGGSAEKWLGLGEDLSPPPDKK
jgi:transcriptional regulator with XRE-family HTH domain